jgi:Glycosyl transferase family 8
MNTSQGIVYIAIGQADLELAIQSARSVIDTASEPQLITVLCDCDYSSHNTDSISFVDIGKYSGAYWQDSGVVAAYLKTCLYRLSPYDKTLYLDTDIRAVRDISLIWDYLDDGIGLCTAYNPLVKGRIYPTNSEEAFTADTISNWDQYNSGMFLFKKSPLMFDFFESWKYQWSKFKVHENMALTRLLDYSPIKPIRLPSKFNDFYPNRNNQSILVHYIGGFKQYLNG